MDVLNMTNEELELKLLENNLASLWVFTQTVSGCKAFVDALALLELGAKEIGDQAAFELIYDARNLAFAKGNYLLMIENQEEFFGEYLH